MPTEAKPAEDTKPPVRGSLLIVCGICLRLLRTGYKIRH